MAQSNHATLLIGVAPEREAALRAALKETNVACTGPAETELAKALSQHRPAAAIVALSGGNLAEQGLLLIAQAAQAGARVVAYADKKDAGLILKAIRAGALDFCVPGEEAQLARALLPAVDAAVRPPAGRLTALFGAKGGAGTTTLAVHLAARLAEKGERVCLLDLDPSFAGVLSQLEVGTGSTLSEVLANMHRLDRELLDGSLARHACGAWLLGHGDRIEEAERIGSKEIGELLTFLRRHYDHLLVDGLRGFEERSLVVLDASDELLLVLTQEVPAVRNATRALELFRRLGYPDEKVRPVVNRFHKDWRIGAEVLAEALGAPLAATVGNDFPGLSEALGRGVLLSQASPRSPFNLDVERLAEQLRVVPPDPAQPERRSFFNRLFSRR